MSERDRNAKPAPSDAPAPDAPATDAGRAGARKSCPTCGKPAVAAHRPFCSRRCADLDLGRWLKGDYRIPAVEPPDGFDEGFEETGPEPSASPGPGRDRSGGGGA